MTSWRAAGSAHRDDAHRNHRTDDARRVCRRGIPLPSAATPTAVSGRSARRGTLLGILPEVRLTDVRFRLAAGDTLLLCTDGATEAGPRAATPGGKRPSSTRPTSPPSRPPPTVPTPPGPSAARPKRQNRPVPGMFKSVRGGHGWGSSTTCRRTRPDCSGPGSPCGADGAVTS
ncbi:SpoIIE family protein phosphatase [Streptomyces sp. NPDC057950]|uniref:SpoIIE family protein phosphatase n=1 Tax=Streptomyces sp. NPDC057950 TaxID=3346288 RepID=UPI0036E123E0